MYIQLKKERREVLDNISSIDSQLNAITQSITSTETKLLQLEKISTKENKKKIATLKKSLLTLKGQHDKIVKAKTTLQEHANIISESIDSKTKLYNTEYNKLENAKKNVKLYDN